MPFLQCVTIKIDVLTKVLSQQSLTVDGAIKIAVWLMFKVRSPWLVQLPMQQWIF